VSILSGSLMFEVQEFRISLNPKNLESPCCSFYEVLLEHTEVSVL
jgi:hypothetical protein